MSNSTRCAACKSLRRKCPQDCVFAPYFPSSNPQRFACVHRIFGASNISKMLQQLPVNLRAEAADCMCFEATSRVRDPVYGCVGIISQLQQQIIEAQCQIVKTQGEIAYHNAQQQQLLPQQQPPAQILDHQGEPSWLTSTQQDPSYLDPQLFADLYQQSPFH
ncbi:hypothetical protein L1049_005192 [Liquidambar formosana]|uniref:LOB domain-containing protein n=1 Tax=Liquidambar formosana TaxID=63359 RepID=A0AAP0X198_LIQFO